MLGYFNFTTNEDNEAYETYLQMALSKMCILIPF